MSRENLGDLRAEVGEASQAYQSAVDTLDGAVAERMGINRTDLRCLEILSQGEGRTPTALGKELGLTSGSVTAMLDRLERLDYVTRSPDGADRRKIVVRITPGAARDTWQIYGPLAEEGSRHLERYTASQLEDIVEFLRFGQALYQRHLLRIADLPHAKPRNRPARKRPAPGLRKLAGDPSV